MLGITYGTTRVVDGAPWGWSEQVTARTADIKYMVKFGSETFEITKLFDLGVRK